MKASQNRLISLSLLPLGSKSAPPLPPPMFTAFAHQLQNSSHGREKQGRERSENSRPVSAFLKICSKPKNFRLHREETTSRQQSRYSDNSSNQTGGGEVRSARRSSKNSHGQVYGRVEAQAALVGAQRGVELDAVAAVDLEVALVVLPGDAELDDALGDRHDLQRRLVLGVLLEERAVLERAHELCRW